MVARFTKDKYGWRCTNVWPVDWYKPVDSVAPVAIYVNVSRAPRLGFCRRPHTYI
jgi:hypothetical protein